MTTPTPNQDLREVAERILACEAARSSPDENSPVAFLVSEQLRRSLSRLVGTAGFASLLGRALGLAKAKVPALNVLKVKADGSLDGFNGMSEQDQGLAGVALIAELLALLALFVGDSLVINLLLDIWPDFLTPRRTILERNEQ